MNEFTKEEIKIAKATRDIIISEDVEELKAVYMAGEICMWEEMQQEKILNIQHVSTLAKFSKKISKQEDCPAEFVDIVNKEFWNLI